MATRWARATAGSPLAVAPAVPAVLPAGVTLEDALAAVLLVLVGLGLLAAGAGVAWIGARHLRTLWSHSRRRADDVRGTVVTAKVEENFDARSDDPEFDFVPVVEYEFHYHDGETYTSRNVYPGSETVPPCDSRGAANGLIAPYEAGQRVTVHVPDDPEAAYLELPDALTSLDMVLRYVGVVALGVLLAAGGLLAGREAALALGIGA